MRRAWWLYLVFGAALASRYWSVTRFQATQIIWPIFGWSSVIAMAVGVWRNKPKAKLAWVLLAAGTAALIAGDNLYDFQQWRYHDVPFPSYIDIVYLSIYPFMIAGMVLLVRRRSSGKDLASLIDTTILTGALGLLSWVFLMAPYTRDDMTLLARLTSIAYPLGDVAVLAVLLRLAVGGGRRPPAFWLLVVGVVPMIASDSVYGYLNMIGVWHGQHPVEIGWIIFFLTWGAAALHPSMRQLSEPTEVRTAGPKRLVAVGSAALIPPLILVVEAHGMVHDALAIGAFTVGMYSLVIVRIVGLARQAAAARTEARFRAVVQHAADAILLVSPACVVTYATPSATELFGLPVQGMAALELAGIIAPNDDSVHGALMGTAAVSGQAEWRICTAQGEWRDVDVDIADLRRDPDVGGLIFTLRDMTQRKEVERLREDALRSAKDASHQKSVFLANMSHEIRTPLNGVLGMIGLLCETKLDGEQRDYAETVTASAEALASIVNDVLDFSRIESGKLEVEAVPFAVRPALEAAMALSVAPAREKGLNLVCVVEPGVPEVIVADRVRLRQVVGNLVANATKFTEAGEVVVRALVDGEHLRIDVTDTGIGIAPHEQERLFEQYVQADASTTRRFGGTGLGLAISKQLVELMGGTIGLESSPGVGSTFRVLLPLVSGAIDPNPGAVGPSAPSACRTLVVSAHPSQRRSIVAMFDRWALGCEDTGRLADARARLLAAAETDRPFDVVFVDEHLSGNDPCEFVRALAEEPSLTDVMFVALSSDPTSATNRGPGFAACLLKPVGESAMFDCLANLMGQLDNEITESLPVTSIAAGEPGGHLLLVEDNLINQKVAVAALTNLGYTVDVAGDGQEAVEMFQVGHYDAVLMDCQMPRMDGYAATREIRRIATEHVPIIAVTASAISSDRETCLDAGMDEYLSKPLDRAALAATIAAFVGRTPAARPK